MTSSAAIRLATAAALAISLLWMAALLAAPHGVGGPQRTASRLLAGAVYLAGDVVCHQRPDRSFAAGGRPLPVCARCTGLYAAAPLACLLALLLPAGRLRRAWDWTLTRRGLVAAVVPTAVTVVVEWATGWTSAPVRAAAGAVLGFAGAGFVCAAIAHRRVADERRGRRPEASSA
jgi:uncharacterized membrane protein